MITELIVFDWLFTWPRHIAPPRMVIYLLTISIITLLGVRVTLLLGGNATGDFKLKPLLVYQSETPRAMRGTNKITLPVFWRSNRKAWVTREVFTDWLKTCFCPEVKDYCVRNGLPRKVLLLLDNAPGHPPTLDSPRDLEVQLMYLPPNTASLMQPMDQGRRSSVVIKCYPGSVVKNIFRFEHVGKYGS